MPLSSDLEGGGGVDVTPLRIKYNITPYASLPHPHPMAVIKAISYLLSAISLPM